MTADSCQEEFRLREIMHEYLQPDEDPDRELDEDLDLEEVDLESLDLLALIVAIEEEFQIELDEETFGECEDIQDMIDYVMREIDLQ